MAKIVDIPYKTKLASQVRHHYSQQQMKTQVTKKIEKFFSTYRLQNYKKGQSLIRPGDDSEYVFLLKSGRVKQFEISYRGDEIIVNIYKPGAFFPLLGAITGLPNRYFFDADVDIEVCAAPHKEVVAFIRENPDVMYDLLKRLYKGMDGVLGRMVQLMSGTAKNRLLYELLVEARRFGEVQKDGSYQVSLPETELGSRAGLTRETVSRQLQKAVTDGVIKLKNRQIIILDIEALETKLIEEV